MHDGFLPGATDLILSNQMLELAVPSDLLPLSLPVSVWSATFAYVDWTVLMYQGKGGES